jgi:hypothetical protein
MGKIVARLYSLQPLSGNLRKLLLPENPFKLGPLGPLPKKVETFFKEHSVIFYRDDLNPYGIIVDGEDYFDKMQTNFAAYRSLVNLSTSYKVLKWDARKNPVAYNKIVKKFSDDYAWMEWNIPVIIRSLDEAQVHLA